MFELSPQQYCNYYSQLYPIVSTIVSDCVTTRPATSAIAMIGWSVHPAGPVFQVSGLRAAGLTPGRRNHSGRSSAASAPLATSRTIERAACRVPRISTPHHLLAHLPRSRVHFGRIHGEGTPAFDCFHSRFDYDGRSYPRDSGWACAWLARSSGDRQFGSHRPPLATLTH